MDKHEAYEIEGILYNLKEDGVNVERVIEVLNPIFENEREKEFKDKRNLKYSWNGYNPGRIATRATQVNSAVHMYQEAMDEENHLNNEVNDILHAMELLEPSDEELLDYAKQLRVLKKRRRKAKDFAESVKPLKEFVEENKQFLKKLGQVVSEINRIKTIQDNRQYMPRVQTTLAEAFDKAKENEKIKQ